MALLIITATGLRSLAWASRPSRCASRGMAPPPAKGSSSAGGLPPVDKRISASAFSRTSSLLEFSHLMSSVRIPKSLSRSIRWASSVGNLSGWLEGSSTRDAQITARAAARGRLAHHRWSVDGCPWRIDFSLADSSFMSSRGSATSISFFL